MPFFSEKRRPVELQNPRIITLWMAGSAIAWVCSAMQYVGNKSPSPIQKQVPGSVTHGRDVSRRQMPMQQAAEVVDEAGVSAEHAQWQNNIPTEGLALVFGALASVSLALSATCAIGPFIAARDAHPARTNHVVSSHNATVVKTRTHKIDAPDAKLHQQSFHAVAPVRTSQLAVLGKVVPANSEKHAASVASKQQPAPPAMHPAKKSGGTYDFLRPKKQDHVSTLAVSGKDANTNQVAPSKSEIASNEVGAKADVLPALASQVAPPKYETASSTLGDVVQAQVSQSSSASAAMSLQGSSKQETVSTSSTGSAKASAANAAVSLQGSTKQEAASTPVGAKVGSSAAAISVQSSSKQETSSSIVSAKAGAATTAVSLQGSSKQEISRPALGAKAGAATGAVSLHGSTKQEISSPAVGAKTSVAATAGSLQGSSKQETSIPAMNAKPNTSIAAVSVQGSTKQDISSPVVGVKAGAATTGASLQGSPKQETSSFTAVAKGGAATTAASLQGSPKQEISSPAVNAKGGAATAAVALQGSAKQETTLDAKVDGKVAESKGDAKLDTKVDAPPVLAQNSPPTAAMAMQGHKPECADLKSCDRKPRIGDHVVAAEANRVHSGHWTLQGGEVASVVGVDTEGDIRLMKNSGDVSGWMKSEYYAFADQV